MKKFWNIFYLLALSVLTACGGGDDPVTPSGGGTSGGGTTPTPTPTTTWTTVTATPDNWDNTKRADMTYQILVYSFADSDGDGVGDFRGIQDNLDYINALGVKAIWLSPIHPNDGYHGYGVTDYFDVNPEYGTLTDFDNLVTACHAKGIKVYLDFVLNHTSKENEWFTDACSKLEDSQYWNFYHFSQTSKDGWHVASSEEALAKGKLKFVLDWSKKTVTVTQVTTVDNKEGDGGIWLYFGDGTMKQFQKTADNTYELSIDYDSSWGFLIRTSTTSWDGGTKYGAASSSSQCSLGTAFALDNSTAADIKFAGSKTWYYEGVFDASMPDLNYGDASSVANNKTFQTLASAGESWIKEHHIDGFRLDAVKHIYDSTSDNVQFLKTWYNTMNQAYKADGHSDDIYMAGEALDEHDAVAPYYAGLPAMFEFSFWYRLQWAMSNKNSDNTVGTGMYFVKDILGYQDEYKQYNSNYIEATKLSNHDEERTAYVLNGNTTWCKQAAAMLLTAQGHPYIYNGEELAVNPKKSKSNGDEYVRGGIPWGSSYAHSVEKVNGKTVSANTDAVATQETDANSVLNVYRSFTKLRNTYPALAEGTMSKHGTYNEDNSSYPSIAAWYMTKDSQKMLVLHNLGSLSKEVPVSDTVDKPVAVLGTVEQNGTTYRLGANSSVVLLLK